MVDHPRGFVDLTLPHERYKLLEAIDRVNAVGGIVMLPPVIHESMKEAEHHAEA